MWPTHRREDGMCLRRDVLPLSNMPHFKRLMEDSSTYEFALLKLTSRIT